MKGLRRSRRAVAAYRAHGRHAVTDRVITQADADRWIREEHALAEAVRAAFFADTRAYNRPDTIQAVPVNTLVRWIHEATS